GKPHQADARQRKNHAEKEAGCNSQRITPVFLDTINEQNCKNDEDPLRHGLCRATSPTGEANKKKMFEIESLL
ncbi:MAG: hypothetical protein MJ077_11105, partial [Oscillospiraceae bacterium]|nr:hypothetical protein [Oscillospiraceae bacterium]